MSIRTRFTPLGGPNILKPTLCTGTGLGTVAWSTQTGEQYPGGARLSATSFGCGHGGKANNQNTVVYTLNNPARSRDGNWSVHVVFGSLGRGYTKWYTLSATYTDGTTEELINVQNVAIYSGTADHVFSTRKTVAKFTYSGYSYHTSSENYNTMVDFTIYYNK